MGNLTFELRYLDQACTSPISNPRSECTPETASDLYMQPVHGQYALTLPYSGSWDFSVKASIRPRQGEGDKIRGEHIRGSVDKVISLLPPQIVTLKKY